MRPRFLILKTLDDGSLHWVAGAQTLESAKERVDELAKIWKIWPGKYVILNQATGERVSITTGGETKIH